MHSRAGSALSGGCEDGVAGRETNVHRREVEAGKISADLAGEKANLEKLQEVLDTQGTNLDQRQTAIESREVLHEQNIENVNAKLK